MPLLPSSTALLLTLFLLSYRADANVSFCDHEGWHLHWSDEFDGPDLDDTVWTKDVNDRHDSRTRQARATADSVWVEDGALVIRSNGTWNIKEKKWHNLTSGAVTSQHKAAWKGRTRVCVQAKLPGGSAGKGTGIWPAHWLMPNDDSCWPCHGEIDLMEMINGNGHLYGTYHWCLNQTCGGVKKSHGHSGGGIAMPDDDWSTEWHEYAVEYGTDKQSGKPLLQYALDGKVYHQVHPQSSALVFPKVSYYAILNTAVGGPWADPPNNNNHKRRLLQAPLQHTQFPTYHRIDWIRVAKPNAMLQTAGEDAVVARQE